MVEFDGSYAVVDADDVMNNVSPPRYSEKADEALEQIKAAAEQYNVVDQSSTPARRRFQVAVSIAEPIVQASVGRVAAAPQEKREASGAPRERRPEPPVVAPVAPAPRPPEPPIVAPGVVPMEPAVQAEQRSDADLVAAMAKILSGPEMVAAMEKARKGVS